MGAKKIPCFNCKKDKFCLTYNIINELVLECAHCNVMRRVIDVEFSHSKSEDNEHRYIRVYECDTCRQEFPDDEIDENSRGNLVCRDCTSKEKLL